MPLLADGSSSVFYPGKLVFALPLDFARRFTLYVALHLACAAWAAYFAARRFGASVEAAGLAAVSYTLGGNVLYHYSNVIFLVGAAWLPLALLAGHQMLVLRSWRWASLLAVVLALMILGGDPQTAYHVLLLAAFYGVLRAWGRRRFTKPARVHSGRSLLQNLPRQRWVLLAAGTAGAGLLAAVQILPAAEWTRVSERAAYRVPRSVWETIGFLRGHALGQRTGSAGEQIRAGIVGVPTAGTHHAHIYDFSVGPWRWPEMLWPNCTGRSFPTNRNWITIVPAERRAWTPSLYAGLLPLCLALLQWHIRRGAVHVRWISWMAVLGLLASLGWYGVGWFVLQIRAAWMGAAVAEPPFGQPVGGLYWLLVVLLPQYAYFRFPAKWFVVGSLAISLLAARGWDRARRQDFAPLRRLLLWIGLLSLSGAVVAVAIGPLWRAGLHAAPRNAVFGPLDHAGAATDLYRGLLHGAVVALAGWGALCRRLRHCRALFGGHRPDRHRRGNLRRQRLDSDDGTSRGSQRGDPSPPRPRSCGTIPSDSCAPRVTVAVASAKWRSTSSPDRQAEIVRWENGTLAPRYQLLWDVSLIESFNSIAAQDVQTLLRVARQYAMRSGNSPDELPAELADVLSVRFAIGPPSPLGRRDGYYLEVAGERVQCAKTWTPFPAAGSPKR